MQRIFLQDCGRFRRGDLHDWPMSTWRGINGWDQITVPLETFLGQISGDAPIRLPDGSLLVRVTDRATIERLLAVCQDTAELPQAAPMRLHRKRMMDHGAQVPD
jgi:hypothetical protein